MPGQDTHGLAEANEASAEEAEPGPADLRAGDVIGGKYRLDRVVGSGGMGTVFEGKHLLLDQRIAVKVLRKRVLRDHPEAATRLAREARVMASIESDHIARVMDVGIAEGAPFMVLEYLRGKDLDQVLESSPEPMPVEQAIDYVLQACEGLAYAHRIGVVHRDLKPSNMFVATKPDGSELLKLLDFGLSKRTLGDKDGPRVTTAMTILGTPLYMAPEQVRGSRTLDTRADIWALGIVLFHLLTKEHPFDGETRADICSNILVKAPPTATSLRGDVPPGLDAVIARCLEKKPDRRFPDVSALAEALGPFAKRFAARIERIFKVITSHAPSAPTRPEDFPPITAPDEDVETHEIARNGSRVEGDDLADAKGLRRDLSIPGTPASVIDIAPGVPRPVRLLRAAVAVALVLALVGAVAVLRASSPAPTAAQAPPTSSAAAAWSAPQEESALSSVPLVVAPRPGPSASQVAVTGAIPPRSHAAPKSIPHAHPPAVHSAKAGTVAPKPQAPEAPAPGAFPEYGSRK